MLEMQQLIDPPMEDVVPNAAREAGYKKDVESPNSFSPSRHCNLGITALWAMEGPPFHRNRKSIKATDEAALREG